MSENSSELEKKLMSVLSNPDALSSIMSIAKGFTQNGGVPQRPVEEVVKEDNHVIPASAPVYSGGFSGKDFVSEKSIGLLLALKPFLSSNKCEKIDTITGLLKVALLTDLFK